MKKLIIGLLASIFLTISSVMPTLGYTKKKVVIVVGPVGARTREYKNIANVLAAEVKKHNADVVKVYSPYATWKRVKEKARGANLFIYLGHGNGWPSQFRPYNKYTKNGLGLNARYGHGNSNLKYYGAYYVRKLKFNEQAVVIFNKLCYASGSSSTESYQPSVSMAVKRVDNYAAPFISAGARTVFAYAWPADRIIHGLFTSNKTMKEIFWDGPQASPWSYVYKRQSVQHPKFRMILDPDAYRNYYRSIVAHLNFTAAQWREY